MKQVFKKSSFLFVFLLLITACNDRQKETEFQPSATTKIDLIYPKGMGNSGDKAKGLIGYGYDATGLSDTISVKAKVLENYPSGDFMLGYPNSSFPEMVSANNLKELAGKLTGEFGLDEEDGTSLLGHIKSLIKLATKSDSIDTKSAWVYYAAKTCTFQSYLYYSSRINDCVTQDFKKDVIALTAKALVEKYGTHVLNGFYNGSKFEVLYRYKDDSYFGETTANEYFQARMKEYVGGTPFYYQPGIKPTSTNIKSDELFIYNSIGFSKNICGAIKSTNFNPDSIKLNIAQLFKPENYKPQFTSVSKNGLIPLYELINDAARKQEVKAYIDKYMLTAKGY